MPRQMPRGSSMKKHGPPPCGMNNAGWVAFVMGTMWKRWDAMKRGVSAIPWLRKMQRAGGGVFRRNFETIAKGFEVTQKSCENFEITLTCVRVGRVVEMSRSPWFPGVAMAISASGASAHVVTMPRTAEAGRPVALAFWVPDASNAQTGLRYPAPTLTVTEPR